MQYLVAFPGAVFVMLTIKSSSDINAGGTKEETKWNGYSIDIVETQSK